jgi:DNA-binding CsgD family transcriptional regulator
MAIHVHSTIPFLQDTLGKIVTSQHHLSLKKDHHIIIDIPRGWVWLNSFWFESHRPIVVSDNPCPEYKLDLLACKPAALIDRFALSALLEALRAVEAGETTLPRISSRLTPTERLTLQLIANGHSIKEVAAIRGAKISTTRNTIQTLYTKLGLKSAVQLSLYYYGNWTALHSADDLATDMSYLCPMREVS